MAWCRFWSSLMIWWQLWNVVNLHYNALHLTPWCPLSTEKWLMDLHNFSLRMLRTSNLSFGKHNSPTRFRLESQDMLKELLKVLSGSSKVKSLLFFPRRLGSLSFPTHFFSAFHRSAYHRPFSDLLTWLLTLILSLCDLWKDTSVVLKTRPSQKVV